MRSAESEIPASFEYFSLLIRRRKFIIGIVLSTMILVAGWSLIMPRTYTSRCRLVASSEDSGFNPLASFSSSLVGLAFGRGSTELFFLQALFESRTLSERVITQFDLITKYEAENMDKAVGILSETLRTSISEENNLIVEFSYNTRVLETDLDSELAVKRFAKEVLDYIVDYADQMNIDFQGRDARYYRQFIEERYTLIEAELIAYEDSMALFQQQNNVILVDEQLKATYQAAAVLEAQAIEKEIEYAILRTRLGAKNPILKTLDLEIKASKAAFEHNFGGKENEKRYLLGYNRSLSTILKEYLRLYRNIEIHSQIFAFATTKLEEAKMREARDLPTISLLDPPNVPQERTAPQRKYMVISAGVLSSILSLLVVFVMNYFERIRLEYPEEYSRMEKGARPTA